MVEGQPSDFLGDLIANAKKHPIVIFMNRQLFSDPCDFWLAPGVCIVAIDVSEDPYATRRAWLDGTTVVFERGGETLFFCSLPPEALSEIARGTSAVVEFGFLGPQSETPIEARAPS